MLLTSRNIVFRRPSDYSATYSLRTASAMGASLERIDITVRIVISAGMTGALDIEIGCLQRQPILSY